MNWADLSKCNFEPTTRYGPTFRGLRLFFENRCAGIKMLFRYLSDQIIKYQQEGKTLIEMQEYFQRHIKSIVQIIERNPQRIAAYRDIGLSQLQISIFEEISRNERGVSFEGLRNKFDLSVPELQGQLGAMTSRWREKSGKNDRMWKLDRGRYISVLGSETLDEDPRS